MDQAIKILKLNEEYFNTLIKIQEIIFDEASYDDIISFIKEANILLNQELFLHLLQSIKKCVFIRPHKVELLLSVLSYLKDNILKDFPKFRWMGSHIPSEFRDRLRKIGLFNLPIRQLKNLEAEKFNKLIELIKSDDISSFQEFISHTNVDINTKININSFKIDKTYNPSLIELSCFFGSLQIFKFLLMNNATRWKMLPNYALAGGNYEIIHILERENVKFDKIEVISEAIKFHRNDVVEYLEPNPFEAFTYCVKHDNIECLIKCLEKMNSDRKNELSFDEVFLKVCFHSVKKNFPEITKILCYLCPDCVNEHDFNHQYMIHRAINCNYNSIAKFLSNFDHSDLNVTNGEIDTPLICAVRMKNIEIVQILCDNEKVDLNAQNFSENTAMHVALNGSSIDIIKILINHKNRLDTLMKNNQQLTYMHFAIMTKNLEIVKLINGLDDKLHLLGNKTNATPLIYAVSYGTPEIVDYLSRFDDVDVNFKNCHGISSLHLAIENPQILVILCNHSKIELSIRNDQGNSPLHLASSKGKIESVKILVGFNGVDINALNDFNNTPLFLAAQNGYVEIVKFLCSQKSIDIKIKNKAGIFIFFMFL